jgi:hypothetical protein
MSQRDEERAKMRQEAEKAAYGHIEKTAEVLRAKGHTVKLFDLEEQTFFPSYGGETIRVDDIPVTLKTTIETKGSFMYTEPTGKFRFYVTAGGYRNQFRKQVMTKKTGIDYEAFATAIAAAAEYQVAYDERRKQAEAAHNVAKDAKDRLTKEFKLGFGIIQTRDGVDTVKVEFPYLTEDQARAILAAAKNAGVKLGGFGSEADDE